MIMAKKIKKILLIQPNYAWLNKRTWQFPPYTMALLKAVIPDCYETVIFDPNMYNLSEEEVASYLKKTKPELVGITSISSEYLNTTKLLTELIRKALPQATIVLGGAIPTVLIDECMKDKNVDYWVMGEGEKSLRALIEELQKENPDFKHIPGLAFWQGNRAVINKVSFIDDLDSLPFPDYSNIISGRKDGKISISDYGNIRFKYTPGLIARKYPFAVTVTSRGCPYRCIFCAGKTVSGSKVRFRSAKNVLLEIDKLYKEGIKEIIFLDDHFLADRKRAIAIMQGIKDREYDLTWKCVNVTAWLLDKEILSLMKESGCSFLLVSIESGNQDVLKNIIKKPIRLGIIPGIFALAKSFGFDLIVNFVIGFPGETWEQIRDTFKFAESLKVDLINFHIATPLPKTELMQICLKEGLLPEDYLENISEYSGYGKGLITTKEFTPFELQVLRSFEWDRINFSTKEKRETISRLNDITMEELDDWRLNTRRNTGINSLVKNIMK